MGLSEEHRRNISEGRRRALEVEAAYKGASRRAWLALATAEAALCKYPDDDLAVLALRQAQAAWDALNTTGLDARAFLEEYGIALPETLKTE